jgi:hypothetical protein
MADLEHFYTSEVTNKSGYKSEVFWTDYEEELYNDGDISEVAVKGITKKGRKFRGVANFIKDNLIAVTWIQPVMSRGWHPVHE